VKPVASSGRRDDRDELERFKREINLAELAAGRGYRIDRQKSSRRYIVMRHPGTDDKIVIARRERDLHWTYFSVRDDSDKGSVVDFVQRRSRMGLGEVRKELRAWTGREPVRLERDLPALSSPEPDRAGVARLFNAAREAANSPYLNGRGIRPGTLVTPRFRGTFRVDGRGNVLFPHRDEVGLCGFEAKNRGWTSFASGGRKTIWTSHVQPTDERLVLVESAIDALSHYQLRPDARTRYGSTAGNLSDDALAEVRRAIASLAPGAVVVAAFDADPSGDKLAAAITRVAAGVAVYRERPPLKDWNAVLEQKEQPYIASLSRRRDRDRGGL
jgi:hypothetical protein